MWTRNEEETKSEFASQIQNVNLESKIVLLAAVNGFIHVQSQSFQSKSVM